MSNHGHSSSSNSHLTEAIGVLRACQPLVARLTLHGVTIQLSKQDEANLLKFRQVLQADYSDSDWSYLRIASGIKVSGIAALTSYLRLHPVSNQV